MCRLQSTFNSKGQKEGNIKRNYGCFGARNLIYQYKWTSGGNIKC